jgi:hypothetical protein
MKKIGDIIINQRRRARPIIATIANTGEYAICEVQTARGRIPYFYSIS